MGAVDSTDPRDVARILALLIQEAELPDIAGSHYQRRFYAFNAHAEDGKVSLWVSDPMKLRRTQVFELTLAHQGWVDDDGTVHPS